MNKTENESISAQNEQQMLEMMTKKQAENVNQDHVITMFSPEYGQERYSWISPSHTLSMLSSLKKGIK